MERLLGAPLVKRSEQFMNSRLRWVEDWAERARSSGWRVTLLAKRCGISVSRLETFFLGKFRSTPREWLRRKRLEFALQLLSDGKIVKEASEQAGYKQPSHFSREFKRLYGVPPTRVRVSLSQTVNSDIKK